jgi:hypothetical protein
MRPERHAESLGVLFNACLSSVINQPKRETNHLFPSIVEVKKIYYVSATHLYGVVLEYGINCT